MYVLWGGFCSAITGSLGEMKWDFAAVRPDSAHSEADRTEVCEAFRFI